MPDVEIEFRLPWGHLTRAENVHLLQFLGETIDSVTLTSGDNGVFTVDDSTVFDSTEDDYDIDRIAREVRTEL